VFVDAGKGAHFSSIDGHDYIDFCLGDTGAMAGHAPDACAQVWLCSSVLLMQLAVPALAATPSSRC
jgi:acetylornithine/succinyldiaminopimelate/putrescine aminotransferase